MAARLKRAMAEYAANQQAHANRVEPMVGSPGKRLRVADYRIIFEETETEITVTKIGPRGDVYA